MTTHPTITKARRDINNMASFVRRAGLTGWVKDRNAHVQYERAYAGVTRVEDALGVDAAAPLAARLMGLRHEAERAGLIDRAEVGRLERDAIARVDAENASRERAAKNVANFVNGFGR